MIRFELEGRRVNALPGRYKGKRRRGAEPVRAECGCGWKSRVMGAKKAEEALARHVKLIHAGAG